jgi:outer membrane protein assembly factor BamD
MMPADSLHRSLVRRAATAGLLAATVLLAGCGGAGDFGDYIWGDSSKPKTTSTSTSSASAMATNPGDAIAPDLAAIDDVKPIAELYNKGLEAMKDGNYTTAVKSFAEVERQHPYSEWATRAILMQAYVDYQRNRYDDAINAAKRFLTLHPGHKDAPYAYYLVGISYYEQITDVKRDQSMTQKALDSLDEVSRRFPGTTYARDAAAKATLARDHLAGKQMEIGRYYQNKKAHLAAINRFKTVITEYQTTTHTPEALYRLTETYLALGVRSEAQTAAAVLGYNYPQSQWYQDAYALLASGGLAPAENKRSWISQAIASVNPF